MLARLFTIVLIPAIIACPMTCAFGICQSPSVDSVGDDQPVAGSCCCPGGNRKKQEQDGPADAPGKSPCQGICGGVVFEKPAGANPILIFDCPPVTAVESPIILRSSTRADCDCRGELRACGNFGRMVCALHMAFLC